MISSEFDSASRRSRRASCVGNRRRGGLKATACVLLALLRIGKLAGRPSHRRLALDQFSSVVRTVACSNVRSARSTAANAESRASATILELLFDNRRLRTRLCSAAVTSLSRASAVILSVSSSARRFARCGFLHLSGLLGSRFLVRHGPGRRHQLHACRFESICRGFLRDLQRLQT